MPYIQLIIEMPEDATHYVGYLCDPIINWWKVTETTFYKWVYDTYGDGYWKEQNPIDMKYIWLTEIKRSND